MLVMEQLSYSNGLVLPLTILVLIVSFIYLRRKKAHAKPIEVNMDEIIEKWTPEPLVPVNFNVEENAYKYITEDKAGYVIRVNGYPCINFATHNYLSFIEHDTVETDAINTIKKYGVGSCGPRGFYGTLDVHLDFEKDLAEFMGTEQAVVYSFGFSTSTSAVYAYIKKHDIVFLDENMNFAIQAGLIAAKCKIHYFKHSNMEDLERLLKLEKENDIKHKKESKKFIIVEGIYQKSGDICPLKEILDLRAKYRARIFLDESISIGVLGNTGRGVTEYFNIPVEEIDLIIGSLEFALGSVGGFCVGSTFMIEHHQLSGAGYCFSASLAPFLTVAAHSGLKLLQKNPDLLVILKSNCHYLHELLSQQKVADRFILTGDRNTPVKYLQLENFHLESDRDTSSKLLEKITKYCIEAGYAVSVPLYLSQDAMVPPASIRVTCNTKHTKLDMENFVETLCKAHDTVMKDVRLGDGIDR